MCQTDNYCGTIEMAATVQCCEGVIAGGGVGGMTPARRNGSTHMRRKESSVVRATL